MTPGPDIEGPDVMGELCRLERLIDDRMAELAQVKGERDALRDACELALAFMESRGTYDTAEVAAPLRAAIAKAKP